jgi:hypothetical protein
MGLRQTTLLIAALALALSGTVRPDDGPAGAGARPEDWIQLFNGRDLTGWTPKIKGYALGENFGRTFRVENGVLKASYEAYEQFENRFGHLFYEKPFSHYVLAVEYRFVGEQAKGGPAWALRNSGAMIHGQSAASMGKDQDFPISIEAQFLGGDGTKERSTANLCTPGTHVVMDGKLVTEHCVNSKSKTYAGDQWVRVEIEVHGNGRIVHRVEGATVLEYEKAQIGGEVVSGFDPAVKQDGRMLSEGTISLQAESHPVEFRKVELLNLAGCMDKRSRHYRPYFEKDDPAACLGQ